MQIVESSHVATLAYPVLLTKRKLAFHSSKRLSALINAFAALALMNLVGPWQTTRSQALYNSVKLGRALGRAPLLGMFCQVSRFVC